MQLMQQWSQAWQHKCLCFPHVCSIHDCMKAWLPSPSHPQTVLHMMYNASHRPCNYR